MKTLFCLMLLAATAAAQPPCKPGVEHRKLDRTALQNLQVQKVNSYKEPWRMDANEVAHRECENLKLPIPPVSISEDMQKHVVSCGPAKGAHTELTLQRPEWLLPYAGTYRLMMWVVTDMKTVCAK